LQLFQINSLFPNSNFFFIYLREESESSCPDAVVAEDDQHRVLEVTPVPEGVDGGGERLVGQRGHVEAVVGQTGGPHEAKVALQGEAAGERLRVVEQIGHLRARPQAQDAVVRVRVSDLVLGGDEQRPRVVVRRRILESAFLSPNLNS
jgi:hypothetical protein